MKKVIFAALVVLLALLAVTCDNAIMPGKLSSGSSQDTPNTPGQVPAVEDGFVSVSIGVSDGSRGRAMSQLQANTAIDFYEVVFYKDAVLEADQITVRDNIQRSVYESGADWNVIIPKAAYTTTNTTNVAVLFAGRAGSPNILLAIGVLDSNQNLTSSTPAQLTFVMSPITSSIGSFTGIVNPGSTNVEADGSATKEETGLVEIGDPVVEIPVGATSITGTYTFNIPGTSVMLGGAATVNSEPVPLTGGFAFTTSSPTVISPGGLNTAINSATAAFTFTFTIPSSATPGYNKIYISVPVYAHNREKHDIYGKRPYIQWYIQGGLDNASIETGSTPNGGAVLLELVLDPDYTWAPVNITP